MLIQYFGISESRIITVISTILKVVITVQHVRKVKVGNDLTLALDILYLEPMFGLSRLHSCGLHLSRLGIEWKVTDLQLWVALDGVWAHVLAVYIVDAQRLGRTLVLVHDLPNRTGRFGVAHVGEFLYRGVVRKQIILIIW